MDSIENLRTEMGDRASVELHCATKPELDSVLTLDGVAEAVVEETTITVQCTDPAAKIDVIRGVDRQVDVVDVFIEDASLEELFNRYTNGGRDGTTETEIPDPSQEVSG
jgi:ABC-2 type transport system ATP-binding protein